MSIYAKYQDMDNDEDLVEERPVISILSFISKWFIRIGMVIAFFLGIYFLIKLQIVNLLLFIIGLLVSYFFGYFFMFCLDKLTTLNDK